MLKIWVSRISFLFCLVCFFAGSIAANSTHFCSGILTNSNGKPVKTPTDGGIREAIPNEFQKSYQKWKNDLLSTEFGKIQWEKYANNAGFILKIQVADKNNRGAGTGEYQWNDKGELVGATILLGAKLDRGYPDPANFPVMNSISAFNLPGEISGTTLAASKFAHEFGHVNQTLSSKREKIETQNNLIPVYNNIFLSNGYNVFDSRLTDLETQMGGTPVKIWENREYFGEATAMNFLLERVKDTRFYCSFLDKINDNVNLFAKEYEDRFTSVAISNSTQSCKK